MNFSEIAQMLYPFLGEGHKPAVFVTAIVGNITEDTDDEKSPLLDLKPAYLTRIYNGKKPISRKSATFVLGHLDKDRFTAYIKRFSADAIQGISDALTAKGTPNDGTDTDVAEKCADLLITAFTNAASGKSNLADTSRMYVISNIKGDIWEASRQDYLLSRSQGSRFANLNILSHLLPHGYVVTNMIGYGRTEDDVDCPIEYIFDKYANDNIALIGEGGIGKTTFLLKIMEKHFEPELSTLNPSETPIFVELNRCPAKIGEWYSARSNKSNFITRYIAAQGNQYAMEDVPATVLNDIEKEFRKTRKGQAPEYWLLLDGLNEVNRGIAVDASGKSTGSTIREMLNTEIKSLMGCPNVRVITTSRKNEMAFFVGDVKNIELTGIKKEEIAEHLKNNGYSQPDINKILSTRKLMDCLRVPLFLCMFTASETDITLKPMTRGEILYGFFNKDQGIYNQKGIMERIIGQSAFDRMQTLFIIDFLLPYIGWFMEINDLFHMDRNKLLQSINEFLSAYVIDDEVITFWNKTIPVFPDYENETRTLNDFRESLEKLGTDKILDFIVNTLGVIYRDKNLEYNFIHHHIRDYFAGLNEIQYMKMAAAYYNSYVSTNDANMINGAYFSLSFTWGNLWSESKRVFIGEILGEHRNGQIIGEMGKWEIAAPIFREQNLFRTIMDIFVCSDEPTSYGMLNITETMKAVRKNLAGVDFSNLDLRVCRLHGVNLSVGRSEQNLSASFANTQISDDTFNMEGHFGKITDFSYSNQGEYLFTISSDDTLKQWETETGRCLRTVKIKKREDDESDNLAQSFMVMSDGNDSFLTCAYISDPATNELVCILQHYSWDEEVTLVQYQTAKPFNIINTTSFSHSITTDGCYTGKSYVIAVFDDRNLYIYEENIAESVFFMELEISGSILEAIMVNENIVYLYYVDSQNIIRSEDADEIVGEALYRIALFDVNTKDMKELCSYSEHINVKNEDELEFALYSPFCVDSKCEDMIFIANGKLKMLSLKTNKIKNLPYNYDKPDFITFANSTLLLLYEYKCVAYNVKARQIEKVYQHGDLGFVHFGNHSRQRLLLFDYYMNPYEWNLANDNVAEKYSYSKRKITGAYSTSQDAEIIVTYDNDSLIIINKQSGELLEAICYNEPDARSSMALYSEVQNSMVFLYVNYFYEYIMCYDLTTSKYHRAYFDSIEERKIKTMFLSSDESHMFCVFEKKVIEIDIHALLTTDSSITTDVYLAAPDEIIYEAYFNGNENTVSIILAFIPNEDIEPKLPCLYEMKKEESGYYRLASWYRLPFVSNSVLKQFSSLRQEDDNQSFAYDANDRQKRIYYINSGLFLDYNNEVAAALEVDKHIVGFNREVDSTVKFSLNPHIYSCILGEAPAALVDYVFPDSKFDYSEKLKEYNVVHIIYVSKKNNALIAIKDSHLIVFKYVDGVNKNIGQVPFNDAISEIAGAEINSDEFVYYWSYDDKLYAFDLKSGEQKQYKHHVPGLIVKDCDFTGAEMSDSVREIISRHGGVV